MDRVFEALAHPIRRRILKLLEERPRSYSELMEELGVDSPTLAFHIKKLGGLVEKNERGFYILTEAGRRALSVVKQLETEAAQSLDIKELELSDRVFLKVGRDLLELAKREGKKVRIFDTAVVEFEKDIPPELFYEVVEEIRDVGVVKTPKHLRPYVETRVRDVGIVTERGLLSTLLKLVVEVLALGGVKSGVRRRRELVEVYRGPLSHGGRVEVEVAGGRVKIFGGPNQVVARCEDARDFEVGEGRISAEGCEVEMALLEVKSLSLDVAGGDVEISLSLSNLKADVSGGVVKADLALAGGDVEIDLSGGVFTGRLKYSVFEGAASLKLDLAGGVARLKLDLPPEVGLFVATESEGGVVRTPKPRPGGRGVLQTYIKAAGGIVDIALD